MTATSVVRDAHNNQVSLRFSRSMGFLSNHRRRASYAAKLQALWNVNGPPDSLGDRGVPSDRSDVRSARDRHRRRCPARDVPAFDGPPVHVRSCSISSMICCFAAPCPQCSFVRHVESAIRFCDRRGRYQSIDRSSLHAIVGTAVIHASDCACNQTTPSLRSAAMSADAYPSCCEHLVRVFTERGRGADRATRQTDDVHRMIDHARWHRTRGICAAVMPLTAAADR